MHKEMNADKKQYRIVEDINGFHLEVMVDRIEGFLWWKKHTSRWLPITMSGSRRILFEESSLLAISPDNATRYFLTKRAAKDYLRKLIRGTIIHHANL